ncbi:type II toxin-antitoxin system VapC family toxin [Thermococcus sibiricus]|uniref:Ribonuclease VapC n=1 Tax=Thermococcus sibiricus (strain DSM 12597 / MM 739) TaxID=604354 RepID=C5ZZZ9_THESM|nr:type II toxin-antitoxin system VapC family toxin [Thermococcus sibiricus]ACS90980.1 Predicted nucleic acid-binding protein, contains PIN domain [Thermococcus sibiricus MM 739]
MAKRVKPELIYMDTSAMIALASRTYKNHKKAKEFFEKSIKSGINFVVGRPVLGEFLNGVSKRVNKRTAVQLYKSYTNSRVVIIEKEIEEDWEKAWKIFKQYEDQKGMDVIDCLSFVIMERLKIREAFTFDRDFETYGFEKLL